MRLAGLVAGHYTGMTAYTHHEMTVPGPLLVYAGPFEAVHVILGMELQPS